jgi:basic membrane protein A and related proteins
MRKQQTFGLGAALLCAALILAACQPSASATPSVAQSQAASLAAPSVNFLACEVTDSAGADDNGFNQNAHQGLLQAQSELGIQTKLLASTADTDYAPNINAAISQKCDLIFTVGFLLGAATQAAAEANPTQRFAIVDYAYEPPIPNVLGVVFDTKSASMLQGYLAAGMTASGTVATFGGIQIGPVADSMDGFVAGVKYYNQQKGTAIKVLGWDPATATGTFAGDFADLAKGRAIAKAELQRGADVIFGVGILGPVGQGAMAAVKEAGNALFIGVDVDQYLSAPTYGSILLSSELKRVDNVVFAAIREAIAGPFPSNPYVGTLANDGVGMAPFHDLDAKVPQTLKNELDALKTALVNGSVSPDNYK